MATTNYQTAAMSYATAAGIDPNIFVKQIQQESGFNPRATSPAGAQGIAQFMPATAAGLRLNPWDPIASLQAAAAYDARNLKAYNGDYKKMLAAYNAGGGAVNGAVSRCGSGWLGCMPSETQHYVAAIMAGASPGTAAGVATGGAAAAAPVSSSSTGGILADLKQWGEYIAIFAMALGLIIIGFFLLAEKQAMQVAKQVVS